LAFCSLYFDLVPASEEGPKFDAMDAPESAKWAKVRSDWPENSGGSVAALDHKSN
jgi:hypothetical protein